MSGHDNARIEAKDKKRKHAQQKLPWDLPDDPNEAQSWEDVEPYLIAYVVQAVSGGGGSVQFTRTANGGALGMRVYDDAYPTKTEWARVGDGLEDLMYKIADYYQSKMGKENKRW